MSWLSSLFRRSRKSKGVGKLSPGRCGLALPKDWRPGSSPSSNAGHMEFYGPDGNAIKFNIGPISPEPTAQEQRETLRIAASREGHKVQATGEIVVGGRRHATVTCEVPRIGILKNYSLIFDGWEYFATAKGDLDLCDSIIKTFRVGE